MLFAEYFEVNLEFCTVELSTWTQDREELALFWVLHEECKRKPSLIYSIVFMSSWESLNI